MSQTLFVNSDLDFLSRIREEAGEQALSTPSMLQALHWITNPELAICGIYLNPNDVNYSALKFLELALLQRPVTPVYLIDSEKEIKTQGLENFLPLSNVKGVFKGNESYREFLRPLSDTDRLEYEAIKKRITKKSERPGYLAIPILDFAHLTQYPFEVFFENESKELVLFAQAGANVDLDYFTRLSKLTSWLYVEEQSVNRIRENLKMGQKSFISEEHFPAAWKTAEALFSAKMLLRELQQGRVSNQLVSHAQSILSDVFQLVSQTTAGRDLTRLVNYAKDCDKNVACTTLSVLMCRALKFERNSIVEILGMASFFQDISLYESPFGNLSTLSPATLSPEALGYYSNHPLLSADLLARQTAIPEVTLQVIRQHHERKDRTGFPNRVGGMQLHPMAEVLSLINAYLDAGESFPMMQEEIFSHYSDRMVSAFKMILSSIQLSKKAA